MRQVSNGERLSGRRNGSGEYPELRITDGEGPNGGALMATIQSFKWADVVTRNGTTELWLEGKTCLMVPDGVVMCAEPKEQQALRSSVIPPQ